VLEHPGVHVEGRELVGPDLALGVRERVQQGGLAGARHPDERHGGVAGLFDRVALAAARRTLILELLFLLGELRLQPADVGLGRLVVRGLRDLLAELLDLPFESHHVDLNGGRRKILRSSRPL
jgi:hypothetical protein